MDVQELIDEADYYLAQRQHRPTALVRTLRNALEALNREAEAYKRAKAENDERFMIERDEARAEVARLNRENKTLTKHANYWSGLAKGHMDKSDALQAQLDGMTKALSRIVDVANFSAIEGVDGFVWRYDMPPGPIHAAIKELNEAGHPVDSVGRVRLNPDVRGELVEFARARIQMVWDDAGEVDATTLAENVVAAQEWLWLSVHFPVEVSS